jgi:hypothetical protein
MKQIFLISIIFVLFPITSLSQNLNKTVVDIKNAKDIRITAEDKAQIVRFILLEDVFLNKHLRRQEKKEAVYLSTEEMSIQVLPKVSGISFVLVSPQEIEEKVKNGFGYFAFQKFRVEGRKVLISFSYIYCDTGYKFRYPGSSGSPNSTNGIRYEFQKVKGKWAGKALYGYVSGS